MMALTPDYPCRVIDEIGNKLVYVEYLIVAPWNYQPWLATYPRYRAVGTALLIAVMAYSHSLGFNGRIGLHSLPQAEGFYQIFDMVDMGIDRHHEMLRYFEMPSDKALRFLEDIES